MTLITVTVRGEVSIDAEKLGKLNHARVLAGRQPRTAREEVENRLGEALGGLCKLALEKRLEVSVGIEADAPAIT